MAKVRATRNGFFGSLRYTGDEFEVPDEAAERPASWWEVLEGPKPKGKAKAEPHQAAVKTAPKPLDPVPHSVAPAKPADGGVI